MIDLLLEKKYNIQFNYHYVPEGLYYNVSGEYLGQIYGWTILVSNYELDNSNFDILKFTEENLRNQIIKYISENLTTTS